MLRNLHLADAKERPQDVYKQGFDVHFDFPVHFTRDLFRPDNDLLTRVVEGRSEKRSHRVKVFLDGGVAGATPGLTERVGRYLSLRPDIQQVGEVEIVPGGEEAKKNWRLSESLIRSMAEAKLCRQSFVLAIGGGSVLDMVGFAASLVHRGLRLIRVPTTVLAQDDAGVGVKNGIDFYGMKNFAGTFSPPLCRADRFRFPFNIAGEILVRRDCRGL